MTEPLPPPPQPEPRARHTGAAVFGALLAAAGLVWLLATVDVVDVSATAAIGALLVLVGLGIALLPAGGHQALLVTAGVVLALLGAAATALDLDLVDGSVGERRVAPTSLTDVRHEYSLGIGSLGIDLTGIELRDDDEAGPLPVRATVGIGEVVVAVPREAALVVDAHVAAGDIDIRGERRSGVDVSFRSEGEPGGDGPAYRLRLEAGLGSIRVVDDRLPGSGGGG